MGGGFSERDMRSGEDFCRECIIQIKEGFTASRCEGRAGVVRVR
jgi:hypothetical protein